MYGPSQEFREERRRNSKRKNNLRRRANRKKAKMIERQYYQGIEENERRNRETQSTTGDDEVGGDESDAETLDYTDVYRVMHVLEKHVFDTSKRSEWTINIMFNRKDGVKGGGGTKSFKDVDFCDTYYNNNRVLRLLYELCEKDDTMRCYNDVMKMVKNKNKNTSYYSNSLYDNRKKTSASYSKFTNIFGDAEQTADVISPDNASISEQSASSSDSVICVVKKEQDFKGYDDSIPKFFEPTNCSYLLDSTHPFFVDDRTRTQISKLWKSQGPLVSILEEMITNEKTRDNIIQCLPLECWLTDDAVNIAIKKIQGSSPYRSSRLYINTMSQGFDDKLHMYNKESSLGKTCVEKLLSSKRNPVNKETLEAVFVAVNPSDCHWQAVIVDLKEAKLYTHCSLGSRVTSVGNVLQSLKTSGLLPTKADGSDLCVKDVVKLTTIYQPDGWSCGDYTIACAFSFFFSSSINPKYNLHLCHLYPYDTKQKRGLPSLSLVLRYFSTYLVTTNLNVVKKNLLEKNMVTSWTSNSCITNDKGTLVINIMRVSYLDRYLGDFNFIQFDETTDNFSPVKNHYRKKSEYFPFSDKTVRGKRYELDVSFNRHASKLKALFLRSFKDKNLAALKIFRSDYHVVAQGLHILGNVESLLRNGLSQCHSTLWMPSTPGRHYIDFLSFNEVKYKFCRYRCQVPFGHAVMFKCFHGGSDGVSVSVGNVTPKFRTMGAKGIFVDRGDDSNATVVTLQSCLATYSGKGSTEVLEFLKALKSCVPTYKQLCKSFRTVHDCLEYRDKDVLELNTLLIVNKMVG